MHACTDHVAVEGICSVRSKCGLQHSAGHFGEGEAREGKEGQRQPHEVEEQAPGARLEVPLPSQPAAWKHTLTEAVREASLLFYYFCACMWYVKYPSSSTNA